ncbi:hypothetical protein [Kitasatospora setae]|nr:hypothetical protein [Kitasatospora setae]
MSGAEDLPALRELRVYDGRLLDADALTAVPGLGSVELYGAKPAGVEFVSGLLRLERLVLENCGPIPSLAPLADHPALREVVLAGRTVVEDGDLSPLVHHPGLRYVALERGAEHYSHRPAEVRRG